jgi:mannose-6-phosphate isomerase-like protein (cupin superfamily)
MRALFLVTALLAAPVAAQPAATELASRAEIQAAVAAMEKEMEPGQTFMWRPLMRGGNAVAALEIWKAPGKPAIHPAEAEYATVVAGTGSLVSGGTMLDPVTTPSGMIEGSGIEGGTTRALKPGDTFLVPAGVPHSFGIQGVRLVLLGIKVPVGR